MGRRHIEMQSTQEALRGQLDAAYPQTVADVAYPSVAWAQPRLCVEGTEGLNRLFDGSLKQNPSHTPGGKEAFVLT